MKNIDHSDRPSKQGTNLRLKLAEKKKGSLLCDGITKSYIKGKSEGNSKPKEKMRMGTDTWNEVSGGSGNFPTINSREVDDLKTRLLKKRSDNAYSFLGIKSHNDRVNYAIQLQKDLADHNKGYYVALKALKDSLNNPKHPHFPHRKDHINNLSYHGKQIVAKGTEYNNLHKSHRNEADYRTSFEHRKEYLMHTHNIKKLQESL